MTFKEVRSTMKSVEDKDVAKTVLDFFVWQYKEAAVNEVNIRCDYNAKLAANEAAKKTYETEYGGGFGYDNQIPYNESYLKVKNDERETAAKNLIEAKALLDFVKNRIIEGFV